MNENKNRGFGEEGGESESARELRAFKGMVDAAGGLEAAADSVLKHTGVAKSWVINWYRDGQAPSSNIARQIFSELRQLTREAKASPKPAKEAVGEMPEAGPVKPPVKERPVRPAAKQTKPKPKLTYRERQKQATESRLMEDEEYRALHKRLVEKGLITPNPEPEKK